ncbi:MAG TPA: hypothetical protein VKC54_02465 [Patescibacteria group bacterium]|nr:hypothetical protein [Patescibacteria group bacterium]
MSKELPGLEIGRNIGFEKDFYSWIPRADHPETRRPITTPTVGLVPSKNAFYPVFIDLTKPQPRNLFIVGDKSSGKDKLMSGLIRYACESTGIGYLKINAITDQNDPNKLLSNLWIRRHAGKPNPTAFPEGPVATRILSLVSDNLNKEIGVFERKNLNPSILIVENLANFLTKSESQPEKIKELKKILSYSGFHPHLNLTTVDYEDLPILEKNGLGPSVTPGVWLFGKAETSENPQLTHLFPESFRIWIPRGNYSKVFIVAFDL